MLKAVLIVVGIAVMAMYYFLVKSSVTWLATEYGLAAMGCVVLLFWYVCYRIGVAIDQREARAVAALEAGQEEDFASAGSGTGRDTERARRPD